MGFLSKRILGNLVIVWISIFLLCPTGFYTIFFNKNVRGFYLLFLLCVLVPVFEYLVKINNKKR